MNKRTYACATCQNYRNIIQILRRDIKQLNARIRRYETIISMYEKDVQSYRVLLYNNKTSAKDLIERPIIKEPKDKEETDDFIDLKEFDKMKSILNDKKTDNTCYEKRITDDIGDEITSIKKDDIDTSNELIDIKQDIFGDGNETMFEIKRNTNMIMKQFFDDSSFEKMKKKILEKSENKSSLLKQDEEEDKIDQDNKKEEIVEQDNKETTSPIKRDNSYCSIGYYDIEEDCDQSDPFSSLDLH